MSAIGYEFRPQRSVADIGEHERRSEGRAPANDLSEILVAGSRSPITCLVRNLSAGGAQIEAALANLPDRFILTNHARSKRVLCEVAWRRGRVMGVRFRTPPRDLGPTSI